MHIQNKKFFTLKNAFDITHSKQLIFDKYYRKYFIYNYALTTQTQLMLNKHI